MQTSKADYNKYLIFILIILFLKLLVLGVHPLHHPSEARYASIAMRMALTGNYLMPYFDPTTPFFAKPPLSIWASAIFFKIFGFSEFFGRLAQLMALLLTAFLVFNCVKKISDKKTALIAILLMTACPLFYVLDSIMTEAYLLLGMTMISTSFWLQIESEKDKNIYGYLFFVGCVIAMLDKGLVGIFMVGLSIFIYLIFSSKWKESFTKFPIFLGTVIFIIFGLSWFFLAERSYPGFLEYFFIGENFDRFAKPGWEGDRFGNAHRVPIGIIWVFFILAILPTSLIFFIKPKQFIKLCQAKIKNSQAFLFFAISFLAPFLVLTFTRNMIMTYAVYSFVPFIIILAILISAEGWNKFVLFLAYLTIFAHIVIFILFKINPVFLAESLNIQDYLIKKIPATERNQNDFELYYLGDKTRVFTLYWHTKDKVKLLNKDNFSDFKQAASKQKKYVIGDFSLYSVLPEQDRQILNKITCAKKRNTCLFESRDYIKSEIY